MRHIWISLILLPSLLVGLPLAGVLARGASLGPYLEFPPLTRYVQHARFSLPVFVLFALVIFAFLGPVILRLVATRGTVYAASSRVQSFPWWGYGGLLLTAFSWFLAWTRFHWFASLQAYTFTPLWLGYILCVNSLTFRRTGGCLLQCHPLFFLALFPLSSLFWWFFEYLNRFVQNWHYVGVEDFSALEYIIHASICFSTVLPAVLSTEELFATFPRLAVPLKSWRPVSVRQPAAWGWLLLAFAAPCLGAISIFPDYLFPMLWIAPFLIITGIQAACGENTLFHDLTQGDWRPIWLPAFAALFCGFFWEMWNFKSLPHWEYSVPFVQRFHLFAMPLLGYGGYLPFGLECIAIGRMLDRVLGSSVYGKKECTPDHH
jgi:hypothetical protein